MWFRFWPKSPTHNYFNDTNIIRKEAARQAPNFVECWLSVSGLAGKKSNANKLKASLTAHETRSAEFAVTSNEKGSSSTQPSEVLLSLTGFGVAAERHVTFRNAQLLPNLFKAVLTDKTPTAYYLEIVCRCFSPGAALR